MSDKIIIKRNGVDLNLSVMVRKPPYSIYMIPLNIGGITYPLFPTVSVDGRYFQNKEFDSKPIYITNPPNLDLYHFTGTFYKPNDFGI